VVSAAVSQPDMSTSESGVSGANVVQKELRRWIASAIDAGMRVVGSTETIQPAEIELLVRNETDLIRQITRGTGHPSRVHSGSKHLSGSREAGRGSDAFARFPIGATETVTAGNAGGEEYKGRRKDPLTE